MAIRVYSRFTSTIVTIVSFALTVSTITYAVYQKKQFYPAVIHITKSSSSMAVLYLQGLVLIMLAGKLLGKIFFGQLRATEVEHLMERSWYALTETCLAFTVFRDDFSTRFVTMFAFLLFFKCFHWLTEDRIDFMERTPTLSMKFHFRVTAMIILLSLVDIYFVRYAYYFVVHKGASVQIVFGFEYVILFLTVMGMLAHYMLHTVDSWQSTPWESKSAYLLYVDLILHFCRLVLYILFLLLMIKIHTFPLFIVRPAYLSLRAFKNSFRDVILSRRAIRYMNTQFPSLTAEELVALGSDSVCIICREDMSTESLDAASSSGAVKRLPCQHVFHAHCLRTWFQRQQTCPTCRMDILRTVIPQTHSPNPQTPPSARPVSNVTTQERSSSNRSTAATASVEGTSNSNSASAPSVGAATFISPMMLPFLTPPNLFQPVPSLASADLARMTDEELHTMEGNMRTAVEARIQCLNRIKILLDAAMLQMNAYSQAIALSSMMVPPPASGTNKEAEKVHPQESVSEVAEASTTDNISEQPTNNLENPQKSEDEECPSELDVVRQRRLQRFDSKPSVETSSEDNNSHNVSIKTEETGVADS